MPLKAGDKLTINATVRAVYAEWAELDITAAGSEPVAPIRVPLGFLVQREETGADMKALSSTANSLSTHDMRSVGRAKRTPNHDRA